MLIMLNESHGISPVPHTLSVTKSLVLFSKLLRGQVATKHRPISKWGLAYKAVTNINEASTANMQLGILLTPVCRKANLVAILPNPVHIFMKSELML